MTRAPQPLAEPELPQARAGGGARSVLYGLMILVVATGAWVRYGDRLGSLGGEFAALTGSAAPAPAARPVQGLIELGLLAQADEAPAIAAMQLPADEAQSLRSAVARRRLRLVKLPVFDRDGSSGTLLRVEASGLTQLIRLGPSPTVLTIPMGEVGNVSFSLAGMPPRSPVAIGGLTLNGPVALPPLGGGQTLDVGVVAQ